MSTIDQSAVEVTQEKRGCAISEIHLKRNHKTIIIHGKTFYNKKSKPKFKLLQKTLELKHGKRFE